MNINDISGINGMPIGMPMEGFAYNGAEYPYGLEIATAFESKMKRERRNLTETEREHIIMECMDARSEKEMDKIIKERVPDGNVYSLFERNEIS